jgi:hypothetical protein
LVSRNDSPQRHREHGGKTKEISTAKNSLLDTVLRNCLKTQDFAHETDEIDEKEEEIFLNLSSFSFLSRVSWAEKYFSNSF